MYTLPDGIGVFIKDQRRETESKQTCCHLLARKERKRVNNWCGPVPSSSLSHRRHLAVMEIKARKTPCCCAERRNYWSPSSCPNSSSFMKLINCTPQSHYTAQTALWINNSKVESHLFQLFMYRGHIKGLFLCDICDMWYM